MTRRIEIVNMEFGYPRAEEAKQRLVTELELARRKGIAVLKIVHGYGSTGKGGKLRTALRTELKKRHHEGAIGTVVFGEAWTIFEEAARQLLDRYPALSRDSDLGRSNAGITLVEIARK